MAVVLVAGAAHAHQMGLSFSDVSADGPDVRVAWEVRSSELQDAVPLDTDKDGAIAEAEVAGRADAICAWTAQRIELFTGGDRCPCVFDGARLRDGLVVVVKGACRCPRAPESLRLWSALPPDLGEGHQQFVTFHFGKVVRQGAIQGVEGSAEASAAGGEAAPERASEGWLGVVYRFAAFGVEHIFTGYDHLCFLLGLLLVAASLRSLLAIVTSFTVAHSVTLVAAALDVVTPPVRIVESAIALSIVYVAVENVVLREVKRRWLVAGAFGLVHGFGFAGVLRDMELPKQHLLTSLVSFNVGVELGQAVCVTLAFPFLLLLRKSPRYRHGMQAASAAIFLLGLYWFVERALLQRG